MGARRRRPLSVRRAGSAAVPYLLVLPVLIAIGAILGYPLYKVVVLSFQRYGLPEKYAWYSAFGLLVGLIFLYWQILRMLSYLRR